MDVNPLIGTLKAFIGKFRHLMSEEDIKTVEKTTEIIRKVFNTATQLNRSR